MANKRKLKKKIIKLKQLNYVLKFDNKCLMNTNKSIFQELKELREKENIEKLTDIELSINDNKIIEDFKTDILDVITKDINKKK